jgi:hypothetical protein
MSDRFFTVVRNLPGFVTQKPNGLMFVSRTSMWDYLKDLVRIPEVMRLLPANKPMMAVYYFRPSGPSVPQFEDEYRLVITTLSYYILPINDARKDTILYWEEPDGARVARSSDGTLVTMRDGTLKFASWANILGRCDIRQKNADTCTPCPLKGRKCVEKNFGYRPWPFLFSYNQKAEWMNGLWDDGDITGRVRANTEHEFTPPTLQAVNAICEKMQPLGFTFRHPDTTRLYNAPLYKHPLRPPRDHRFYPKQPQTERVPVPEKPWPDEFDLLPDVR